ncbi:MAG: hypothetical protein DHS20C18_31190 [Saprospiraceae bacterium]|nr:MAG: hypothetical protein DHS20C18_31190 [Saprospiraceae bacterium]
MGTFFNVSAQVFINEVNYKASDPDDQGVEITGKANIDLDGWSMVFYHENGSVTNTETVGSISIPNQDNGYGSIWFDVEQSRSSSGVALVDPSDNVISFFSYGDNLPFSSTTIIITATEGPADGLTSVNIGTQSLSGTSLELTGTGSQGSDFVWSLPSGSTPGQTNTSQYFSTPSPLSSAPNIPGKASFKGSTDIETPIINGQNNTTIKVYPNPANDLLQVQFLGSAEAPSILEIFDFMGRKIQTTQVQAGIETTQLQLFDLPEGQYLLNILTDQKPNNSIIFSKQ